MDRSIILASRSPRRVELLSLITSNFKVFPSNFDESKVKLDNPIELVKALSFNKANSVFQSNADSIIIGCDTVVSFNGKIYGIPKNKQEAKQTLLELSGKTHFVTTGVCILSKQKQKQFQVQTEVAFYKLTIQEINDYIKTDEPYDKAGGYGIQGKGSLFIHYIKGDYFSVVGLPVSALKRCLDEFL